MHGLDSAQSLADFLLAGHFNTGHSTSFGKLIDEKVLPQAFGTRKLDAAFRAANDLTASAFDNIDHIIDRPDGRYLLSLKASRWTIQLGQAVDLNRAFGEIIALRDAGKVGFSKIIVGVFYGKASTLSDKYDILRGTDKGANHNVADLSADVEVFAGRDFWEWLGGNGETQAWVLAGILKAISTHRAHEAAAQQTSEVAERGLVGTLSQLGVQDSAPDWSALLQALTARRTGAFFRRSSRDRLPVRHRYASSAWCEHGDASARH